VSAYHRADTRLGRRVSSQRGMVAMACGNNKVSLTALHTLPRPTTAMHLVAVVRPHERAGAAVAEKLAQSQATVREARSEMERSASTSDEIRKAVCDAQLAVAQARRAGVGREAMRHLQRELAELERTASKAVARTDADQEQQAALQLVGIAVDRLAPAMLGVPTGAAIQSDDPPPVPDAVSTALADATRRAQTAALLWAAHIHLAALAEEKKAAQHAVLAAKRGGATGEQVDALQAALKTLQQLEAKLRRKAAAAELPFGTLEGSGLHAERTETLTARPEVGYDALRPSTAYTFGDQTYVTDGRGQPAFATGELHLQENPKALRHREGTKIGHLGNVGDVGGHLIAAMFGGFGSGPNLVPQNMKMNSNTRLMYGELEAIWKEFLERGARVHVDIRLQDSSTNPNRPEGIFVRWRVDAGEVDVSDVLKHGVDGTHENFFPNDAPS
jgi:hypothetical protein